MLRLGTAKIHIEGFTIFETELLCCIQAKLNNAHQWKKISASFLFFLLPEMYEMDEWERESKIAEMYTEWNKNLHWSASLFCFRDSGTEQS